jgi:hypothetical protein
MAVSTFKPPDDGRLVRRQDGKRMRIPGSITVEDFREITRILGNIRQDIEDELGKLSGGACPDDQKPKELHIRLNESDKPYPVPIFAGWVESEDVRVRRLEWNHPDPGLHRFGDDVYSEIYGEAINYANNPNPTEHFRYRDWAANELLEKRAGEKATDPKAGNTFQTCLAMVIDGLATGTLVVGFRRRPTDQLLQRAQEILREWARERDPKAPERSALIDFLRKFELGGPRLANSNWWDFIPKP